MYTTECTNLRTRPEVKAKGTKSKPVERQAPTVRVTERCKAQLELLSKELDLSQTEILEMAVLSLKRARSLRQMAEDYEAIAGDKKASKTLAEENATFDGILGDGLD